MPITSSVDRNVGDIVISFPVNGSGDVNVYTADRHVYVTEIREAHNVVGGASAAVTVKKCTGTTAPASGTALHGTPIDLTATINTVVTPTLTTTYADRALKPGDRLAFDYSGTTTNVMGAISIVLSPIGGHRG